MVMRGGASIFDSISSDDLIMAFFPCIHFCDAKTMIFKGEHISQRGWTIDKIMDKNIELAHTREYFYITLLKLCSIVARRGLSIIIENPWNTSGETYLQRNFIAPTIIDKNRTLRGDFFVKPTAYWFINCEPTQGKSYQCDKPKKTIMNTKGSKQAGLCSEERSMISPDYARNFICDFILGKKQEINQLQLF